MPTLDQAVRLVRPGGHVANIGVRHASDPSSRGDLEPQPHHHHGVGRRRHDPTLLLLTSQQLDAGRFFTHHFTIDQFEEAYDVFAKPSDTGALKVVLTPS